ncbi:DUF6578 domain-containing protein [Streptomyces sp. NBC_00005]|uniref:DUF6578 domain-containing protein n=1 Tax=Streptomyces sp. NBC_00005 TaxID=2903609 RepID=UPI003249035F
MGLWHVFYAGWQMECCGTPLAVGDEVSRPLLPADADEMLGGGPHDQPTKLVGSVGRSSGTGGSGGPAAPTTVAPAVWQH